MLTDTTKHVKGLANLTDYYWRVRAKNETGWGGYSNWSKFTTIIEVPEKVQLLFPSDNGVVNISEPTKLIWRKSELAMSYTFQLTTDLSFRYIKLDSVSILDTSVVIVDLDTDSTYYWRVSATNSGGTSSWSEVWEFEAIDFIEHSIMLNSGWNMISSYVNPTNEILDSLLVGISNNLKIMKNGLGKVYIPEFSINSIGNWEYKDGYQLFIEKNDTLILRGLKIIPEENQIPLGFGWNMFSYLLDASQGVVEALSSIGENIIIVKDIKGRVYIPEYGINTLGNLEPGQGYKTYLASSDTLLYLKTILAKSKIDEEYLTMKHFPLVNLNTGSNSLLLVKANDISNESEICVKTKNGKTVGTGVFVNGVAIIAIWGDNAITEKTTEGATEGEELILNIWDQETGEERNADYSSVVNKIGNSNNDLLKYSTDGFTEVVLNVELPLSYELMQNYPNPFNPSTMINFKLPKNTEVKIVIYNVLGSVVQTLVNKELIAGEYKVEFNAESLSSGVYFYSIKTSEFSKTRKMILLK
jgi:hypothetical protein